MLNEAIHNWEVISSDKTLNINNATGLTITNDGDVSFFIAGRKFVPGMHYIAPIYGSPTDFAQQIRFDARPGRKSAVVEYTKLKKC